MSTLDQIAEKIIHEQELVIGPLAWTEAAKVFGLQINRARHEVQFTNGNPRAVVDRLVQQYERLFGRASHEVCRNAVASIVSSMPRAEIPTSLQ